MPGGRPGRAVPNVKETNPNKIVSGFGGTLCFVLSSVYIIASLALPGAGRRRFSFAQRLGGVSIIGCVLSIVIGWLPMRIGLKQLKDFEA